MRPVYFHLLFEQHRADNLSIEKKKEKSENYVTFFFVYLKRQKKQPMDMLWTTGTTIFISVIGRAFILRKKAYL